MADEEPGIVGQICEGLGDDYQSVLLQHSELDNGGALSVDPPGDYFPGQEADALVGEVEPPAPDTISITDVEALPQTIDADYEPVPEEPAPAPEPEQPQIGYDPGPDAGQDIDADPSF